jgi:hypothetical protein
MENACVTPMSDHVARFWKCLETETVHIVVDMKRVVGADAPDGPVAYWDGATFSDDIAKALVADRARHRAALESISRNTCCTSCQEAALVAGAALYPILAGTQLGRAPDAAAATRTAESCALGLDVIARQIEGWLAWHREHRDSENLTTDGDTSIMCLPVPVWPNHAQFEAWISVMRDAAAVLAANDDLVQALKGVVAVADRKTDEFDRARAAIAKASRNHHRSPQEG